MFGWGLSLALASGAAALVYESIWLRWFHVLFGNTAYAASATLAAFFAGIALGSALGGRLSARTTRPLRTYARVEAGAALTALLVPAGIALYEPIYAALYERLAENRALFTAIKFALAFAAVLPTSTLLGATLPLLARAVVARRGELAARGGALYAINTLGAAGGTALGSLWLPDAIGVTRSYAVAMALSTSVALAAAWAARSESPLPSEESVPAKRAKGSPAPARLRAVAFASGFGTLAFEVLLIHAIALSLESSVYSFGAVLIVVLGALALAAAGVSAAARRVDLSGALPWVAGLQAAGLLLLPFAISAATRGGSLHLEATFSNGLALAVGFGGFALCVGGLVLPLTFRLAELAGEGDRERTFEAGRALGSLVAINTLGGIAGSVCASFVLLDGLGLWRSLAVLALVYAALAVATARRTSGRKLAVAVMSIATLAVALGPLDPGRLPVVAVSATERLIAVDEGAHGTVSVVDLLAEERGFDRRLRVDGHYTLSGALARRHQERLGHLPLVLHSDPRRVLFIATATGQTASAAVVHPVDEIVLVELVPEVRRLAAQHFAAFNRGVYDDPRTRAVVEDGRNHVRAVRETYDVIATDLLVPWRAGAGALYTREHFEAAARRLAPGGVFCLWLPLYQLDQATFATLAATLLDVFPDAELWRGDFFRGLPTAALVARNGPSTGPELLRKRLDALDPAAREDRWIATEDGLSALRLGRLADAIDVAGVPRNSDDWPRFEYLAARSTHEARQQFRRVVWPSMVERLLEAPDSAISRAAFADPEAGRRIALALHRGFRALASRDPGERARAAEQMRRDVPEALLREPDPSVAEIWPPRAAAPGPALD